MSRLTFMMTITERKRLSDFVSLFQSRGIAPQFLFLGYSTAAQDLLNVIGLGSSEKAVMISVVTDETWAAVKKDLRKKIFIDMPGAGIAFTVPLSSIGGRRELAFLTNSENFEKGDESALTGTQRELIVTICEQGHSDEVMDAARAAGAGGGTIIHARGTGIENAEKFLGVTLASEKDIILIVALTSAKASIMSAIMKGAGLETGAKAICFSLPVTDTAGLRLEEDDGDTE